MSRQPPRGPLVGVHRTNASPVVRASTARPDVQRLFGMAAGEGAADADMAAHADLNAEAPEDKDAVERDSFDQLNSMTSDGSMAGDPGTGTPSLMEK